MRIGFFSQGEGPHLDMARHLIDSVHRVMPGVQVLHLTDSTSPAIEGAEAIRIGGDMPMGVRRLTHYSRLEGEWCFVDTDVVFLADVRPVFGEKFDVALATRKGSYLDGSQYAKVFPYNFGVVFSRNPAFWLQAVRGLEMLSKERQEWEGEQWVTGQLANSGLYALKVLERAYNYTPERVDESLEGVKVLHLKGPRKTWLPQILGGLCSTT